MKHLLHLSGGGFKGVAFAGCLQTLHKERIEFDVVSGISIGAVLAVPFLLGKAKMMAELFRNVKQQHVFSLAPVNDRGKITLKTGLRLACGKSAGKQDNLIDMLRFVVTKYDFDRLCKSSKKCYVGYTDVGTGRLHLVDVLTLEYKDYIDVVNASASLPVYTEKVNVNGKKRCYDGGVRCHNLAYRVNKLEAMPGDISLTCFSRPYNYNLGYFDSDNNLDLVLRVVDMMSTEISKRDEEQNNEYCADNRINNYNLFTTSYLKGTYDWDPKRLEMMFLEGQTQGELFVKWWWNESKLFYLKDK